MCHSLPFIASANGPGSGGAGVGRGIGCGGMGYGGTGFGGKGCGGVGCWIVLGGSVQRVYNTCTTSYVIFFPSNYLGSYIRIYTVYLIAV